MAFLGRIGDIFRMFFKQEARGIMSHGLVVQESDQLTILMYNEIYCCTSLGRLGCGCCVITTDSIRPYSIYNSRIFPCPKNANAIDQTATQDQTRCALLQCLQGGGNQDR